MRILAVAVALAMVPFVLVYAQQRQKQNSKQVRTNPASACGDDSSGIPDSYYDDVVANFKPPGFEKSLISIAKGAEIKLVLMTDGDKFELWTDSPDTPKKNVNEFLLDLDDSCRLPADPAAAAALIKIKWESKELSPDQFLKIHRDFTNALSQYVAKAQDRYTALMDSRALSIHLDAISYPVVYDNNHEHIEVEVLAIPEDPMTKWVQQLQKLGEDSFHRSFEPK